MTLNERILDFLDGSLPPDDEAELLHTLSRPNSRTCPSLGSLTTESKESPGLTGLVYLGGASPVLFPPAKVDEVLMR